MGSPKKAPKPPPPVAPPVVPSIDEARVKQNDQDRINRMRGRAASILTGPMGDLARPMTAAKSLLGA